MFDLGLDCMITLAREAFTGQETWQGGVRAALAAQLAFLESDPQLARVWLVESLGAGTWALKHRERNLTAFKELVIASWPVSREWNPPPLAAEGAIAAILGIVHAHIVTGRPEPLIELLGPLVGLAVRPYLSPRAAAREVELGERLAREIQAGIHGFTPGAASYLEMQSGIALPALLGQTLGHQATMRTPLAQQFNGRHTSRCGALGHARHRPPRAARARTAGA